MRKLDFFSEIYFRFGTIQRARDCFLYTKKGVRLTDLYQQEGRAILGWSSGKSFTVFKNVLNRGISGSFITEKSFQIIRAVEKLFDSKRKVFFYSSYSEAIKSGLNISVNNTSFFRPWNFESQNFKEIDCIVFIPPFAWAQDIFILAVKEEKFSENLLDNSGLIESLPSPLVAAIARSIYDLIAAFNVRSEKNWFGYDKIITKYWIRKGPYLFPKMEQSVYDDFVLHCLDCNLVISPDFNTPSIVPFGADVGVFSKLKNNPFDFCDKVGEK